MMNVKTLRLGWLLPLMVVWALNGGAQITNKGRDFWVGYGHHQFMETDRSMNMVLYLSAEDTATVTVTIHGSGGGTGPGATPEWKRVYKMNKNTVISTGSQVATDWAPKTGPNAIPSSGPMPKGLAASGWDAFFNCTLYDSWGAEPPASFPEPFKKKAIHITSTADIVAYAHIYGSASSGATMLLPVKAWGYNYTAINSKQQYAANTYGWMYVMAEHDNTYVEITPSQPTKGGRVAGVPFYVILNRGEIYQIAGVTSGAVGLELTGTRVRSLAKPGTNECYPVAVFCGSSRTSNPALCGSGGGDNDNQQMFPHEAWGKRYLLSPLSSSTNPANLMVNMYKVVTNDPATVVKRKIGAGALNAMTPTISSPQGNIYYFESNTADYLESDKPMMVAQFMSGGSGCLNGGVGDPEMIYLSPIEQAINRIGFYRNTWENITTNYITLSVPTPGLATLKIDNVPWASIPAGEKHSVAITSLPGYTLVAKKWTVIPKGPGAQCIVTCDSFFNAVTYGLGSVESYGYNAGTFLNNLNIRPSIRNVLDSTVKEHSFTCTGTQFDLSILSAYPPHKIEWLLSQVPAISPATDVSLGNLTGPLKPIDTILVEGIPYYKYMAPGGPYSFNKVGVHRIPVRLYNPLIENCYNREDLEIFVEAKQKPVADFSVTLTGCPADSARFTGVDNNGSSYKISSWWWKFPDNSTNTGIQAASLLPIGNSAVNLRAVSAEGCVADTAKQVMVPPGATADFTVSKTTLCEGEEVTFTPAPGLSSSKYFWDFGDGRKDTLSANAAIRHTYQKFDTLIASLTLSASGNCSPISTQQIVVRAKPILAVSYPAGCLPVDGIVQFQGLTTVPDGQTIAAHLWHFGDPNASVTNPNTSVLPNPTHTYQYGTYNINYTSSTNGGCFRDTIITATFNIKPDLVYDPLAPVCQNSAPASVAKASVRNSVPGKGYYRGPATDSAGMFSPAVAGPGTYTIWYMYAATSGCLDSVSQTILVYAAPQVSFTHPTGCLPAGNVAQFTSKSSIADGQQLSYAWNFGDANANAANPNTSTDQNPTHIYSQYGTYAVKHTVSTDKGCIKDTTISITLAVRPQLSFAALPDECQRNTPFSVAKATLTNGVAGKGYYKGAGTDSAGQMNSLLAGPGTHTIWFVYEAQGGCMDSVSQTVRISATPVVRFTFPQGCLPANNTVAFTNQSTVADVQTLTYQWNFGDPNANAVNPNTSTAVSPSHRYSAEGNYDVKLTVTSQNGCVADTIIRASLAIPPVISFAALAAVCENATGVSVAKATVTNSITGNGVYKGPGTSASGQFDAAAAGPGTHIIWFVFTTAGGCADSALQNIRVHARPVARFTFPQGCLPANNTVTFANQSTIADAQTLAYLWSFGDPNAAAGNPNTSTAVSPGHRYSVEGNYDVKLTVTSQNGCVADTTIRANLAVPPVLAYSTLNPVCANSNPVSVANGSVTNGVAGRGVYKGAGTTPAGMFNPKIAGAGTHKIWFVYTTAGGCADSVAQDITVKPLPVAAFTASPTVCLSENVAISDQSSLAGGTLLRWHWNYGNGTSETRTNGASFAIGYAAAGNYTISLVVDGSNGCSSDTARNTATVHPLPVADFDLPANVCMPGGQATFTNRSTIAGGGNLSSLWNLGDNQTSVATNASHIYASAGSYNVTLIVTSAFGCKDTATKVFDRFLQRPAADFDASPAQLCQGSPTTFTDRTVSTGGAITQWRWNFGDGTTGTNSSEIKTYRSAGDFNVSLWVTNAAGCVSDTAVKQVKVYLQPVIDAGRNISAKENTVVRFAATANDPNLNFRWTPATGLSDPATLQPTLTVTQDQVYVLTATGAFGCKASDSMRVSVQGVVVIPNAFSPNGDGINDVWVLKNLDEYPAATLEVYDRYGKLVYRGGAGVRAWDGNVNGKPLPAGVYYYVIDLRDGTAARAGSVTILR
jgi:gliding motility-associated-like protein